MPTRHVVADRAAMKDRPMADGAALARPSAGSRDRCGRRSAPGRCVSAPMTIGSWSPRRTAPNQMPARAPSFTPPITDGVGRNPVVTGRRQFRRDAVEPYNGMRSLSLRVRLRRDCPSPPRRLQGGQCRGQQLQTPAMMTPARPQLDGICRSAHSPGTWRTMIAGPATVPSMSANAQPGSDEARPARSAPAPRSPSGRGRRRDRPPRSRPRPHKRG